MHCTRTPLFSGLAAMLLFLLTHVLAADALTLTYCSSQNTGSDNGAQYWTWQSNGWCSDTCKDSYAFGIVQGNNCWCSNYAPGDQEDTSNCNKDCPGFPSEKCGSQDGTLFGYIALGAPSGTEGASQPTSTNVSPSSALASVSTSPAPVGSSSEAPSSEAVTPSSAPPSPVSSSKEMIPAPDPTTVVQTVIQSASVITVTPAPQSSSAAPTTLKTSASTEAPSSQQQASPSVSIQTLIISDSNGQPSVIYKTIMPSSAPSSATSPDSMTPTQKKSTNVGAIVGGVLGGIALIAAIVGGIIFLLWRRRRQQHLDGVGDGQSGVQRNTSTMSKAGLIGRSEKITQYPPKIQTSNRNSRMMGDSDSISPISGSDRRSSRPYVFDQRLNPSAIMVLDNTSRGSFVSMDDSRDYGRTLNVRNPDPDTHEPK